MTLLLAIGTAACAVPSFNPSGKACSDTVPCPEPYLCTALVEGSFCLRAIELQEGVAPEATYAGAADTTLYQSRPTFVGGQQLRLFLTCDDNGDRVCGDPRELLLRWEIPPGSWPEGARLRAAALKFTVNYLGAGQVKVYRVLRPWNEQSACWDLAATGQPWTAPGLAPGADREEAPLAEFTTPANAVQTVLLNQRGMETVNDWLADPSLNHGIVVTGTDWRILEIPSAQWETDPRARPMLLLWYEDG